MSQFRLTYAWTSSTSFISRLCGGHCVSLWRETRGWTHLVAFHLRRTYADAVIVKERGREWRAWGNIGLHWIRQNETDNLLNEGAILCLGMRRKLMDLSSRVAVIGDCVFSVNKVYSRSSFQRLLRICKILKVHREYRTGWLGCSLLFF